MLVNKRFIALTLSTAMAATLITGCGTQNTNTGTENTAEQTQATAEAANISDYKGSTFIGRVTSVNGNEITLSIGGGHMSDKGQRPDMNNDNSERPTPPDMDNNNNRKRTPPDMNNGNDDKQTTPDADNDNSRQTPPDTNNDNSDKNSTDKKTGENKKERNHDNKTLTITIDDESILEDISLSDISEGTRITVTVDDSGSISKIASSNDNRGQRGKGGRTNKENDKTQDNTNEDTDIS